MLLKKPIRHTNFYRAFQLAFTFATSCPPGTLVFVTGPSGAGKSTLKIELFESMYGAPVSWQKGEIPVICVRASNSEAGYFSSKDFYTRMLTALGDPFRGGARDEVERNGLTLDRADPALIRAAAEAIRLPMTEMHIRRTIERLARVRGLKAILIDEAQSMCLTHWNRSPSDHLESLKCLAEEIGVVIYFFGTYDLLQVWNHSSQLNRRSRLIHLERYLESNELNRDDFCKVLAQLVRSVDFLELKILSKHAAQILEWTLGIFGEVEGLFERARDLAVVAGRKMVEWDDIVQSSYNPIQQKRLLDEVAFGESIISGNPVVNHPVAKESIGRVSSRRRRMPGRRNPKRDRTGNDQ